MNRFFISKFIVLFLTMLFYHTMCKAQYTYVPPIETQDTVFKMKSKTPFFQKKAVQITFVPTLFFAGAAATWHERKNIREIRNRYLPGFKNKFDDFLQYTPALGVYALKLSGVKGRNNWLRTTVSYGTSLAIMAVLVNGRLPHR